MATIKLSPHLKDLKGKIHTTVYSKNKSGNIAYSDHYTTYDWTEARLFQKDKLDKVAKFWSDNLSDSQYSAWSEFSEKFRWLNSNGNEYKPSAYELFSKLNLNLLVIGLPVILNPPKNITAQSFKSFSAEILFEDNAFDINLYFNPAIKKDTRIKVFATLTLPVSKISVNPKQYRKLGYIDSTFKSGDSIITLYASVFGLPKKPKFKIGLKFEPVSAISGLPGVSHEILTTYRENP